MQTLIRYKAIGLAALAILFASCALLPTNYGGAPIEGLVIDARTKKPLEGVIVVQYWELRRPTVLGHSNFAGVLHIDETKTDSQGRYAFRRWGPMVAPVGTIVDSNSPSIRYFRPGYLPRGESNYLPEAYEAHALSSALRSDWSGKTIGLDSVDNRLDEYENRLISQDVRFASMYRETCDWLKIPMMIGMVHKEKERLRQLGISSSITDIDQLSARSTCGDVKAILKEYLE